MFASGAMGDYDINLRIHQLTHTELIVPSRDSPVCTLVLELSRVPHKADMLSTGYTNRSVHHFAVIVI